MIHHDVNNKRFTYTQDGALALLEYRKTNTHYDLLHTEVPKSLGGQGIGGKLVAYALETAQAEKLRVHPYCEYVQHYVTKHPEIQSIVDKVPE